MQKKKIVPIVYSAIELHKGSKHNIKYLTQWEHFYQEQGWASPAICSLILQQITGPEIRAPRRGMERSPVHQTRLPPIPGVSGEPLARAQLQVTPGLNSLTSAWSADSLWCWLPTCFKHQMRREWSLRSVVKFLRTWLVLLPFCFYTKISCRGSCRWHQHVPHSGAGLTLFKDPVS